MKHTSRAFTLSTHLLSHHSSQDSSSISTLLFDMSDRPDKPAIPAWQRAAKSPPTIEPSFTPTTTDSKDTNTDADAVATSPDLTAASTSTISADDKEGQREQIRAFLQDPIVKDQAVEKKRAFLKSKDMPGDLIDEELGSLSNSKLDTSDFAGFREQAKSQQPVETQTQPPPPIITYPEFLANAHGVPPLITPTRILATTYFVSATAALAYAANTFLIKPMTAALTDSRHDLAMHSLYKVDDFNSRLEKLVSQIPRAKSDSKEEDSDSVASDPTELFSRDQGTQTAEGSVQPSKVTISEPTMTAKQAETLTGLQKSLEEVLVGTKKEGKAVEEREENVKKLRHYLDSLSYGGSSVNIWSNSGGHFGWEQGASEQQKEKEKRDDAIEELKKEIRGVKGVLLSAKRFPAAGRSLPGSGTPYSARRVESPA